MEQWEGSGLNRAKEILAFEVTRMVHGEKAAEKSLETARTLFASAAASENMPTTELSASALEQGEISVVELLVAAGLAPSRGRPGG
jgi:tyrosyl-tRNA synthetase